MNTIDFLGKIDYKGRDSTILRIQKLMAYNNLLFDFVIQTLPDSTAVGLYNVCNVNLDNFWME